MTHTPAFMGFVAGALAMGYLIAAAFLLRFWRAAREGLFLAFSVAFALMALAQVLLLFGSDNHEWDGHVYLPRLAAFMVIIVAILLKNLPPRSSR